MVKSKKIEKENSNLYIFQFKNKVKKVQKKKK